MEEKTIIKNADVDVGMSSPALEDFQSISTILTVEDLPENLTRLYVDSETPLLELVLDKFHDSLTHLVIESSDFFPTELTYASLKSLRILNCNITNHVEIENIAKNTPILEEVFLENYKSASDGLLFILTAESRNLRRVRFEGCENLETYTIESVLVYCPSIDFLERVEFLNCFGEMTEKNLDFMVRFSQFEGFGEKFEWEWNAAERSGRLHRPNLEVLITTPKKEDKC